MGIVATPRGNPEEGLSQERVRKALLRVLTEAIDNGSATIEMGTEESAALIAAMRMISE